MLKPYGIIELPKNQLITSVEFHNDLLFIFTNFGFMYTAEVSSPSINISSLTNIQMQTFVPILRHRIEIASYCSASLTLDTSNELKKYSFRLDNSYYLCKDNLIYCYTLDCDLSNFPAHVTPPTIPLTPFNIIDSHPTNISCIAYPDVDCGVGNTYLAAGKKSRLRK